MYFVDLYKIVLRYCFRQSHAPLWIPCVILFHPAHLYVQWFRWYIIKIVIMIYINNFTFRISRKQLNEQIYKTVFVLPVFCVNIFIIFIRLLLLTNGLRCFFLWSKEFSTDYKEEINHELETWGLVRIKRNGFIADTTQDVLYHHSSWSVYLHLHVHDFQ